MRSLIATLMICVCLSAYAQTTDENTVRLIFDTALGQGESYQMLEHLTGRIGPRLSGSPGAAAAVEWSRHVMQEYEFDSVWLQPVMVPHWIRGQKEEGRIINSKKMGTVSVNICALGGSVGTGPSGIAASIIEVKTFEELKQLGASHIKGKIVFFNRPMDPTKINTFNAYSGAVNQRGAGASEAARYGAVAVVVRSMGSNIEDYPHRRHAVCSKHSPDTSSGHQYKTCRVAEQASERRRFIAVLYGNTLRDARRRSFVQRYR